jgi:hypothetical protein
MGAASTVMLTVSPHISHISLSTMCQTLRFKKLAFMGCLCYMWIVQGSRPGWPTEAAAGNWGAKVSRVTCDNVIRITPGLGEPCCGQKRGGLQR